MIQQLVMRQKVQALPFYIVHLQDRARLRAVIGGGQGARGVPGGFNFGPAIPPARAAGVPIPFNFGGVPGGAAGAAVGGAGFNVGPAPAPGFNFFGPPVQQPPGFGFGAFGAVAPQPPPPAPLAPPAPAPPVTAPPNPPVVFGKRIHP